MPFIGWKNQNGQIQKSPPDNLWKIALACIMVFGGTLKENDNDEAENYQDNIGRKKGDFYSTGDFF